MKFALIGAAALVMAASVTPAQPVDRVNNSPNAGCTRI
jgi:hypothetical protein